MRTNDAIPARLRRLAQGVHDESGSVLILVAVALVVLMGFVGLAVDVGGHYNLKRSEQTGADGGALQGAYEILRGNTALVNTAANNGTTENGYQDGTNGAATQVYHPPASGYYIGDAAAVEVVVAQPGDVTFMSLFGFGDPLVRARAVAWAGGDSSTCIHILEDVEQDAFDYQSSALLNAPACALMVNSCDNWAGHLTSNSNVFVADAAACGNYVEESSSDLVTTSGQPPQSLGMGAPDPLAWLPPPSPPVAPLPGSLVGGPPALPLTPWGATNYPCDHVDWEIDQSSINLSPGVYCGKFTLKNATHAHLAPGMYIMQGGPMKIEGDSILEGTGVTFYFTHSGAYDFEPFSFSSNAQAILSAPTAPCTTGTAGPNWPNGCATADAGSEYYGILFYSNPHSGNYDDEFRFESNTNHVLTGTVYMPNHIFNVESSSVINSQYLIIVVRRMIAESNSVINIGTNFPPGTGAPLKRVTLVE